MFIAFSFLGWIYESIWCKVIEQNAGFVNRGVLFGPWLPIYGIGIMIIYYILKKMNIRRGSLIFLTGTVVAAVVELIGSYIMEWAAGDFDWDYSEMFGNFQGRIALKPDMIFGFLTLIAYFGVMPYLKKYREIDPKCRNGIDLAVFALFLADLVFRVYRFF